MNAYSLKSLGAPIALVGWALSVGSCDVAAAEPPEDIALKPSDSIANGRLLLEIRPRFAVITETNKPEKTEAWTMRSSLGWQTAPYHDLRLTAQYIFIHVLGPGRLNTDPAQGATSPYPLLPDPANTGINQLFVDHTGLPAVSSAITYAG